jgi:hypothetical protein
MVEQGEEDKEGDNPTYISSHVWISQVKKSCFGCSRRRKEGTQTHR